MDPHVHHGSEGANVPNESSSHVSHGRGGSGGRGKEQGEGEVRLGFLNCRGWWLREVDINMVLQQLNLGLAETFLVGDEVPKVVGYQWFGRNRVGGRKASGGVGLLVRNSLKVKLLNEHEGVVWVELKADEVDKLSVAVNPEGVRVQES